MSAPQPVHAFTDDVLGDRDAVELARLIHAGELSAAEVTDAAIARAEKVNPQLNAVVVDSYADVSPRPGGRFAGVPTFVKDNVNLAGLPTGHGSEAITPRTQAKSEPWTRQFLSAGLTPLGKSTLPEFGFNAGTEFATRPPTRNPWNTDYSPGASSGGSAALVAAGVVPIAHANDGGGSIRIPAACCGLVGLKPTRGRFHGTEYAKLAPVNIVANGVVTRSVRDTAAFFAAAEEHHRSPELPRIGEITGPASRKLRIGLITSTVIGTPVDTETRTAVNATAVLLERLGHTVEDVDLPVGEQFADDFVGYWSLLAFLAMNTGKLAFGTDFDPSRCDGLTRGLAANYRRTFYRTPGMIYRLRQVAAKAAAMFDRCDVILSPVLAHTTPEIGYLSPNVEFDELLNRLRNYVGFTPLNNVAGLPGLSLPLAQTSAGLPIGVHFSAAHGDERTLLELAYELEANRPFRRIGT